MRIVVVSDTHGSADLLAEAVRREGRTDAVLHLGDGLRDCSAIAERYDGLIYVVRGNCDFASAEENEQTVAFGGVTVFMTHGHLYDAKTTTKKLLQKGADTGAGIVCFGHTHVPLLSKQGGVTLLNPGSLRHGKTYALIDIRDGRTDVSMRNFIKPMEFRK